MATLVVVAGVAGALYMRRGDQMMSQPSATSPSSPPVSVSTLEAAREPAPTAPAAESPDEAANLPGAAADPASLDDRTIDSTRAGYAVGLASGEQEEQLQDKRGLAGLREERKSAKPRMQRQKDFRTKQAPRGAPEGMQLEGAGPNKAAAARIAKPTVANVVTGADGLIDEEDLDQSGARGDLAKVGEGAPPKKGDGADKERGRNSESAYRAYKDGEGGPSWEETQTTRLKAAWKGKRCQEAGKIANDILDRNPDFYTKRVKNTKAVTECSYYVKNETKRRARKRRATKKRASGGSTSKAKAAPQRDEAAASEAME
jgi:hypothetical protein